MTASVLPPRLALSVASGAALFVPFTLYATCFFLFLLVS
jgi:hypothetical protein